MAMLQPKTQNKPMKKTKKLPNYILGSLGETQSPGRSRAFSALRLFSAPSKIYVPRLFWATQLTRTTSANPELSQATHLIRTTSPPSLFLETQLTRTTRALSILGSRLSSALSSSQEPLHSCFPLPLVETNKKIPFPVSTRIYVVHMGSIPHIKFEIHY